MSAAADCQDLVTLSKFLGVAPQHLFSLVARTDTSYIEITIPKKNGTGRRISIPSLELKGIQRLILKLILQEIPSHACCYSYRKKYSVVAAATRLCGNKNVLKFDLLDFFPSISSKRVFGYFRSHGFTSKSSYIITELTTYRGALAQGAPTSPYISNIICFQLDKELDNLAKSWGVDYIRYSDDMYFFGSKHLNHTLLRDLVGKIVRQNDFYLNITKTKYYLKGSSRKTLGLETSGVTPKFTRAAKRKARAIFHKASQDPLWATANIQILRGAAEWHKCVYGVDDTYLRYNRLIRSVVFLRFHTPYKT